MGGCAAGARAVVVPDPACQMASSIRRRVIGAQVGLLPQGRLDEALGFAVGAGRVGPCAPLLPKRRSPPSQTCRRVDHFNVTEHLTAAWTAQQVVDTFPDGSARLICSTIATASTGTGR
jgi:hypothetical protein